MTGTERTQTPPPRERIGVILVHGIGEQKRFEHLNGQGRQIIEALRQQHGLDVTTEIIGAPAAAYNATQESWYTDGRGPVRAHCRGQNGDIQEIDFHEVWWADINEPYSFAKQIRFWLWGLSIWNYSKGSAPDAGGRRQLRGQELQQVSAADCPANLEPTDKRAWRANFIERAAIYAAGSFLALVTVLISAFGLIWQRLLGATPPKLVVTFTNYLSAIKIFNQRHRLSGGWPINNDLLDTLAEPPRVSIRARMIRAIAQVALVGYDRWYIVAHSQGTVVALNGLMETPAAWPGYFGRDLWDRLVAGGFAGAARPTQPPVHIGHKETMPHRPVWVNPDDIAYRAEIFSKFRGLITLGSPLDKVASLWPARVPVCLIPAFHPQTLWLNVFDPLDPVSGVLQGFSAWRRELHPEAAKICCPAPVNFGYKSCNILLQAHLTYLNWAGAGCLADRIAQYLLTDTGAAQSRIWGFADFMGAFSFAPGSATQRGRAVLAALELFATVFAVAALTGSALRLVWAPAVLDGMTWCDGASVLAAVNVIAAAVLPLLVGLFVRQLPMFSQNNVPSSVPIRTTPVPDPAP